MHDEVLPAWPQLIFGCTCTRGSENRSPTREPPVHCLPFHAPKLPTHTAPW
jgi:hypothetical protein